MEHKNVSTIINKQTGNLAFKLFFFDNNCHFDYLQRNNFYTIIWIKKGNGLIKVDFSEYLFSENTLFAFSPYQPFMFSNNEVFEGVAIQFHSDFYCIHRNPKETNCDTILFNNIFDKPFFEIDEINQKLFDNLISQINSELLDFESENYELLIPILKIFLVTASRLKSLSKKVETKFTNSKTPYLLVSLKKLIEENYKQKHTASDYANLLNISPNSLAKLVKQHFNKTLSELISERIIIEAKRELYMTSKPIQEIAWNLGYNDAFYFSRFFKKCVEVSPQLYRETVGYAKAELN